MFVTYLLPSRYTITLYRLGWRGITNPYNIPAPDLGASRRGLRIEVEKLRRAVRSGRRTMSQVGYR